MKPFMDLELLCAKYDIKCERNVILADRCTFKIGGMAGLVVHPASEEHIYQILTAAARHKIPLLVMGRGSNLLISDDGFHGAVLHIGTQLSDIYLSGGDRITSQSGAALSQLCLFALDHGLSGLEFAYGIPGTVGGAIYMNAGAYGGEMKDVLISTRYVSSREGVGTLEGDDMRLSYRRSAYTGGNRVITSGVFQLKQDHKAAIRARMDDYMNRRKEKQPLDLPSAGSVFKRPEGAYASALIDECNLKGKRVGGAMVSQKHAGFIVNIGRATYIDVRNLIDYVQRQVKEQTGYDLECEVQCVE